MAEPERSVDDLNWSEIQEELDRRGGLVGITIDPSSVDGIKFGGNYGDTQFIASLHRGSHLVVASDNFSPALVDGFSLFVGYQPFAQYEEPLTSWTTTVWDKEDPDKRYQELKALGKTELERLD